MHVICCFPPSVLRVQDHCQSCPPASRTVPVVIQPSNGRACHLSMLWHPPAAAATLPQSARRPCCHLHQCLSFSFTEPDHHNSWSGREQAGTHPVQSRSGAKCLELYCCMALGLMGLPPILKTSWALGGGLLGHSFNRRTILCIQLVALTN
jgi:hypothetical protein